MVGVVGVAYDITELKRAEQSLSESEERLRTVVENAGDGIFTIDTDGRIVDVNQVACDNLGYTRDELPGTFLWNFSEGVTPDMLAAIFKSVASSGPVTLDRVHKRKDGTTFPVEVRVGSVQLKGRELLLCLSRDMTERRKIEQERERLFDEVSTSRKRLKALSNQLVEVQEAERLHLARELHDEIGQVLTGLQLTLESGKRRSASGAKASIDEAQVIVGGLVERVRELSLDLRPAMLDDLGLVPALVWYFDRYTSQTNVRVKFSRDGLEGRLDPEVETAAFRVVQEALTNVARHSGVDEVAVRLLPDRGKLLLEIADNGTGFDPEAAQADARSMGLVGMRERTELLGGRFVVKSAPGDGAKLTAELPLGSRVTKGKRVFRA